MSRFRENALWPVTPAGIAIQDAAAVAGYPAPEWIPCPIFGPSMTGKDYYSILGLAPSASLHDIRKAYRKLALRYHPDKNPEDPYAATRFGEIKEAYEVLTDPAKKASYLQQRWYDQTQGRPAYRSAPRTPPDLLKRCLELNRYVNNLDPFRLDREGLISYLEDLLSDETIEAVAAFREPEINRQIIRQLLGLLARLDASQAARIGDRLNKLAGQDAALSGEMDAFLKRKENQEKWDRRKPFLVLVLALLICLVIYFATR
ncbi:MAG TPA: DnaJ domain-containing protein [Chitinophagaceae bacterium]|nr:DnaJ domain-containing protein [Chitinophagaceae bacterium]